MGYRLDAGKRRAFLWKSLVSWPTGTWLLESHLVKHKIEHKLLQLDDLRPNPGAGLPPSIWIKA
jgi:hypothetical protein